jgi:hypothetical protein
MHDQAQMAYWQKKDSKVMPSTISTCNYQRNGFYLHDAIGTVLMKMKLVGNKEWSRSA